MEDGNKSRGNLLVVLPTLPPDSRRVPLFMLNRVEGEAKCKAESGWMSSNDLRVGQSSVAQHAERSSSGTQSSVQCRKSFRGTIGGSRGHLLFVSLLVGVYLEGFDRRKCVCQSEYIKHGRLKRTDCALCARQRTSLYITARRASNLSI